jgi:cytolysin-activating lysine-acyltransferase
LGRLAPGEWKSGEQLWLIDFIAPLGGDDAMIKELREKVFSGQKVKTLQRAADGSGI